MFKSITRKYIRTPKRYFKLLFQKLPILMEHPFYYFKEWVTIFKSIISTLLIKFPNLRLDVINRKIHGITFKFYFKFATRYRSMYLGLNSTHTVRVLLKYVKKGSCFIDAGAHIGYISAIAAGLVGKQGQVHSFEPVPIYFEKLDEMSRLNKDYKIYTNNFALGDSLRKSNIYVNELLIGTNSIVSGLLDSNIIRETIEIEVKRLDDYIFKKKIQNISLIKIDVEGYELLLLKGLTRFFEKYKDILPPLLIEITPAAYSLLGSRLEDLDDLLKKFNYIAFSYNGKYKIDIKKLKKPMDVLFKQKKEARKLN
jgi:FkbM family methyltransferase